MARRIASAEGFSASVVPHAGFPITLATFFRVADVTDGEALVTSNGAGTEDVLLFVSGGDSTIKARHRDSASTQVNAVATAASVNNTWHHAACVFSSKDDVKIYLDAGNTATGSVTVTDDSASWTTTALNSTGGSQNVDMEFAAIWSAALTDAEVTILASGVSPLLVRPGSLAAFWPLNEASGNARGLTGFELTETGTIAATDGNALIHPTAQIIPFAPAAGGASGVSRLINSGLVRTA